jgi:hypothetical protein
MNYYNRILRWMMLIGTGAVVLQAAGCQLGLERVQTVLLGGITVLLFQLARNV